MIKFDSVGRYSHYRPALFVFVGTFSLSFHRQNILIGVVSDVYPVVLLFISGRGQ